VLADEYRARVEQLSALADRRIAKLEGEHPRQQILQLDVFHDRCRWVSGGDKAAGKARDRIRELLSADPPPNWPENVRPATTGRDDPSSEALRIKYMAPSTSSSRDPGFDHDPETLEALKRAQADFERFSEPESRRVPEVSSTEREGPAHERLDAGDQPQDPQLDTEIWGYGRDQGHDRGIDR
jgi:hypothetical protein